MNMIKKQRSSCPTHLSQRECHETRNTKSVVGTFQIPTSTYKNCKKILFYLNMTRSGNSVPQQRNLNATKIRKLQSERNSAFAASIVTVIYIRGKKHQEFMFPNENATKLVVELMRNTKQQ